MRVIQTKFLGPARIKGARIKVWVSGDKSRIIPYPSDVKLGASAHRGAAVEYCVARGWGGRLFGGQTSANEYTFILFSFADVYHVNYHE